MKQKQVKMKWRLVITIGVALCVLGACSATSVKDIQEMEASYTSTYDRMVAGPFNDKQTVGAFSLQDFFSEIKAFPSQMVVGPVNNERDARNEAEAVWIEMYGDDIPKEKKPYKISYDAESGVWLASGSLPPGAVGGVPYILLRESDGKVLAVWHDK
jgi:hypothetical protein